MNSLVQVDEDTYALGFMGSSDDGYVSTFTVRASDQVAPTISAVTLAADNSTITVTLDEAVFNSDAGSGSLEASDFALSISGGTATLSSATPTSIAASGNLYTLGIGFSGTPDGSEVLTAVPVDNGIYDAAGNEASTTQSNNTVTLNDQLAATISSVAVAANNATVAVTISETVYKTNGASGALELSLIHI